MHYKLATVLALAASAAGATIEVDVGEGNIRFDPDHITAAVGDVIEFHFYANATFGPHAIAVSDYSTPCVPATGSFFTGYLAGDSEGDTVFSYKVEDTNTKWIYCPAKKHCQFGMTAVINPPAAGSPGNQTLAGYKAAAAAVASASGLPSVTGGTVSTASGSSTGGSSSPTPTTGGSGTPSTTGGAAPATTSKPGAAPKMMMDVGALAAMAGGVAALLI